MKKTEWKDESREFWVELDVSKQTFDAALAAPKQRFPATPVRAPSAHSAERFSSRSIVDMSGMRGATRFPVNRGSHEESRIHRLKDSTRPPRPPLVLPNQHSHL